MWIPLQYSSIPPWENAEQVVLREGEAIGFFGLSQWAPKLKFGISEKDSAYQKKEHGLLRLSKRACSPLIKPQSAPCPRSGIAHNQNT